jgi:HPt (histidine-containing phosphotransfer) domain-containing protein
MKAKEYLSQAIRLDHRISSRLEQLENLKALAMRVTSNLTQEKVSGGRNIRGPFENTMAKIIDLEKEINQEVDQFIELKQEIMDTICQVEDVNCQLVLEKRYISGKSWGDISLELGYSRSGVFRIHGEGLKEINEILKKWTKMD